ncbi:MAG: c-type cytochrome biogenesis protein CcmI, partial [Pseudomonadota bacterium]
DAKQARAEIARRLLAAETKILEFDDAAGSIANRKFGSIALVAVAAVFVPAIAALTYSTLGSPSMETQPLAARVLAEQNTQVVAGNDGAQIRDLVERAEAHLQANPNDGRGWEVLAPIYFRLGRGEEARAAYANAIRMLGENGSRLSGMGEVEVAIAGGVVNEAAKESFEAAILLDSNDGRSLFFLGLEKAQSGAAEAAIDIWQSLAQNPNSQQEWRAIAARQLAALSSSQNIDSASAPPIDQDAVDQLQSMSAEDRQVMIEGMVSQLDARLTEQGGTVEEWLRLIRARVVLNQLEMAMNDLGRALETFSQEEDKLRQIRALAIELNLSEEAVKSQ